MENIEITNRYFKVVLNTSVHYLWKDRIVDIRMGVIENDVTPFSTELVPCVEVYERKKFLWIFPYKKCVFSCSPVENTQEQTELLKDFYIKLYEWWKFNRGVQNENTDN